MKRTLTRYMIGASMIIALIMFAYVLVRATVYAGHGNPAVTIAAVIRNPAVISDQLAITTGETGTTSPETTPSKTVPTPPSTRPLRLNIPSLKINAAIQKVGINSKGDMGVPTNFTDVGWYKYGTVPGELGSAVIGGHADNGLGLAGVFKNLSRIQKGDDIYVTTATGKLHFVVTNIDSYDYKNTPVDMIFNQADATRLRLITCVGSWISRDKTYDKRLVVTAILVKT